MKFLADSNVLSEPTKLNPNARVIDWIEAHEPELVVDSVVLGEVLTGILIRPLGRKRRSLELRFADFVETIVCLPWDFRVAKRWASLLAQLRANGVAMPILDGMIAATALTHSLTVATRNVEHFRAAGVRIVNPFE